jgi:hypothetical protein
MNQLSILTVVPLVACFAFSPAAKATLDLSDTAYGTGALYQEARGYDNSAFGNSALYNNTTGHDNTANGLDALFSNSTGAQNTATGSQAFAGSLANGGNTFTTGRHNTATGFKALSGDTTGNDNTADGHQALMSNQSGSGNTAMGQLALTGDVSGWNNTAIGRAALYSNSSAYNNTAIGVNALYSTTGTQNTATGVNALKNNTTAGANTANGFQALMKSTGANNVGLGVNAGLNLTTGSGNVCVGAGVSGVAGESNTTRIRNVYTSVASGRVVYFNSDNKIGTLASSRRYKEEIKPMDNASQAILALKPVTFRYKKEVDRAQALSFGLIAEDVAKVDPDLITRDEEGKPESVHYEAVNAMLLNEFLKEHCKVEQQEKEINQLKAQLKEQKALIQKVSDKL